MTEIKKGDLVWIVHHASDIVRNEEIATKGVVIRKIAAWDSIWYRVFMSWSEKTRITDFPAHMLKRVSNLESR